jgi:predicted Zn-dependent peptidase
MSFVSQLRSLEGLSDQLAWFQRLGSWRDLAEYPKRIAAADRNNVPAVATRYLDVNKATVGLLMKEKTVTAPPTPQAPNPATIQEPAKKTKKTRK